MPSTIAVPAPREFVRQLPSAQAAPFLVINDYTPSAEREEILNALADEGAAAPEIRRLTRWRLARLTLHKGHIRHRCEDEPILAKRQIPQ